MYEPVHGLVSATGQGQAMGAKDASSDTQCFGKNQVICLSSKGFFRACDAVSETRSVHVTFLDSDWSKVPKFLKS